MARGVRFKVEPDQNFRRFIKDLPDEIQRKVFVAGGGRAARQGLAVAKANAPKSKAKPKKYAGSPHMRDVLTTKQKTYKKTGTVFMVGPRSKQAPHTHLVEKGTAQRFTNNVSLYANKESKLVRVKGRILRRNIKRKVGNKEKVQGAARLNRGRMPAFGMLAKALAHMRASLPQNIEKAFLSLLKRWSK